MSNFGVYLLAFSPHPTDIEMGIGGTIARLTRENKEVVFVCCTNGETSNSDPAVKLVDLARRRKQEQLDAAKILGVKNVIFLEYPDMGLADTPKFRKDILRLILQYRPEIVSTCDPFYNIYQSNPDHRVLGRVVLDAVWPIALAPNAFLDLQAEGYNLHKTQKIWLWQTEKSNTFVDITDTLELKRQAINCRGGERVASFKQETDAGVVNRAKAAAEGRGYAYGESYYQLDVLQRL